MSLFRSETAQTISPPVAPPPNPSQMTVRELRDEEARRSKEIEKLKATIKEKIERRDYLRGRVQRKLASTDEQSECGRLTSVEIPIAQRELGERQQEIRAIARVISERLRMRREAELTAGDRKRELFLSEQQLEKQMVHADGRVQQLMQEVEHAISNLDRAVGERAGVHARLVSAREKLANHDEETRARLEEIYPMER